MPGVSFVWRQRARWLATLCVAALFCADGVSARDKGRLPTLHTGAVELGVAGSMTTVEGVVTGSFSIRSGMFREVGYGVWSAEIGFGYLHVQSLDATQFDGMIMWQHRVGATGNYPFVALGGGVRHEEIGSFGQSRYPLGVGVGLRSLFGQRAGLRVEYQYRRILNDPVADFSEHHIVLGLSVFFRNQWPKREGDGSK